MLTEQSRPCTEQSGLPTKRVLVVDDCQEATAALATILEMLGHQVAVANSGVAAIEAARGFHPDVCLLDIALPVMDGYEVGKRLRAEHENPSHHLCLVALSGYSRSLERERTEDIGFDAYLTKPVNFDALAKLITG